MKDDLSTLAAALIYNVLPYDVTPDMRSRARPIEYANWYDASAKQHGPVKPVVKNADLPFRRFENDF